MIKTVFFGSSVHSVTILQKLLTFPDFQVFAVITKEDKPSGRNQKITPNPVAQFSRENNLTLFQISEFDPDFKLKIKNLKLDIALCVAFGPPYFDTDLITSFNYGIVNIHPSPLPHYRGATPGPWQIINGETSSAVTFFQIDEKPDHGPIIAQIPFKIAPDETSESFYNKAFAIAADQLGLILESRIKHPESLLVEQDHSQKTYFPKFDKDTAQIDWTWDTQKIFRFINAMNPWPIAWTYVTDQKGNKIKMKIFSSSLSDKELIPSEVQLENKSRTHWVEISKYYHIAR